MAIFETDQAVFNELSKRLSREPDPDIWELLVDDRCVGDVINAHDGHEAEESFETLVSRAHRLAEFRTRPPKSRALHKRETEPSARMDAIALILAAEAAYSPAVRRFRRKILRSDSELTGSQAKRWLMKQMKDQGEPTIYVERTQPGTGPRPALGLISRDPRPQFFDGPWNPDVARHIPKEVLQIIESGASAEFPKRERRIPKIASLSVSHKNPLLPGNVWSLRTETVSVRDFPMLPVRVESPLGELKRVAVHLERTLGLDASDWARFVIMGTPPEPLPLAAKVQTGPCPALDTIEIRVPPTADPKNIVRLFQKSKRRLLEHERETLGSAFTFGQKTTDMLTLLAIFAAQQNNGQTWEEVRLSWNRLFPDHKYSDFGEKSHFSRDARDTYKRITGKPLKWKRKRGRGPRNP